VKSGSIGQKIDNIVSLGWVDTYRPHLTLIMGGRTTPGVPRGSTTRYFGDGAVTHEFYCGWLTTHNNSNVLIFLNFFVRVEGLIYIYIGFFFFFFQKMFSILEEYKCLRMGYLSGQFG